MLQFTYDIGLMIEGNNLDDIAVRNYIESNIVGDSLLVVGDDELLKVHFQTNEPWLVLSYCSTLGEVHDIVVENMDRQSRGLQG